MPADSLRDNTISNMLKGAFLENRSASSVLSDIRGTELAIRTQDFYSIARDVHAQVDTIHALWELDRNAIVTPEYTLKANPKGEIKYSFHIETAVKDSEGNWVEDKFFTVNSEDYMSKQDAMDELESMATTAGTFGDSYEPYDVVEVYYHE